MKTFYLLFCLIFSFNLYSQYFDKNFEDGTLYFKIKDDYPIDSNLQKSESNLKPGFGFLGNIIKDFQVISIEKVIHLKNSSNSLDRIFLMRFERINKVDLLLKELTKLDMIDYAEKLPFMYINYQPNDPLYLKTSYNLNWNWHWDKIQAEKAWDLTKGSSSVLVAVLDNAVWSAHEDLTSKIIKEYNAVNKTTGKGVAAPPAGTATSGEQGIIWSHGTHTSGLIGANSNNNTGVASIGFNTGLLGVRVAEDNGVIYIAKVTEAIQWAADNGARIINISLSTSEYNKTQELLLQHLKEVYSIVTVAAAGNSGTNAVQYPANLSSVISVAATDDNDNLSSFSQYGQWVNIAAPGGTHTSGSNKIYILSSTYSFPYYAGGALGNIKYDVLYGTSQAAPVVSGVCALLLSLKPGLSPEQVKNCLVSTTDPVLGSHTIGGGRVNAYKALLKAQTLNTDIVAGFKAAKTSVNINESVQFYDISTGLPDKWNWSFEGGSPANSDIKNPVVVYTKAGKYSVSLTASNSSSSNSAQKSAYITVNDGLQIKTNFVHTNVNPYINFLQDKLYINSDFDASNSCIKIYNLMGKLIFSADNINLNNGVFFNSHPKALYIIKMIVNSREYNMFFTN